MPRLALYRHKAVPGETGLAGRGTMGADIGPCGVKTGAHPRQRLDDIVGLFGNGTRTQGDMRLAIFQPEHPGVCHEADPDAGMCRLERDKDRGQKRCDAGDGGDKKLARHRIDLAPDAAGQLAELVFRGQGDRLQVPAGLGRGVAAGMALKQLCSQPFFQRVDMADHGCMMHAQRFGGT